MEPWPAYHQGIFPQPSPSHRSRRVNAVETMSSCFYGRLLNGSAKISSEEFLGAPHTRGACCWGYLDSFLKKFPWPSLLTRGGGVPIPGFELGRENYVEQGGLNGCGEVGPMVGHWPRRFFRLPNVYHSPLDRGIFRLVLLY
jgi:hypothetical protein